MLTGLFIATKWFFNNNKNLCYHAGFVFIGVKPTLKVYIKGLAQMCDFALEGKSCSLLHLLCIKDCDQALIVKKFHL